MRLLKGSSILHVSSSLSRASGGLQGILAGLTGALADRRVDVELWGLRDHEKVEGLRCPTRLFDPPPLLRPAVVLPLAYSLRRSRHSLLHLHGLWTSPSLAAAAWRGGPKVLSPHGMLDPWALRQSLWKKRLAWLTYEGHNLRSVACFHALSEAEAEAIQALGFRKPIALIPGGVDLPSPRPPASARVRTLLYVGRYHPKKNLEALLEAWRSRAMASRGWRLRLCGWGDPAYIESLKGRLSPGASLEGPVFGRAKEEAFRRAHAFVLPSFSEGLPVAVLEALSYSLPVLMSTACNLPEGFACGAAIDCGTSPRAIAAALEKLERSSVARRRTMALRARRLVEERFHWPLIAEKMESLYAWLLGQGPCPAFVRRDKALGIGGGA